MTADSRLFDEELLRRELSRVIAPHPLELSYLTSCDSTNRECQRWSRHGSVVISEQQTAGRGRRGRSWHSPKQRNLYCSIGLEKQLPATALGLVSLLVGIGLVEALVAHDQHAVALKWPNDLLMHNKKLGGILIENRVLDHNRFFLTVGIGLNLQLHETDLETIGQPAIGLDFDGDRDALSRLVAQLIGRVMSQLVDFQVAHTDAVIERFKRYDALQGKTVKVITDDQSVEGLYAGVHRDGRIMIDLAQGRRLFSAADISIRGTHDAAG